MGGAKGFAAALAIAGVTLILPASASAAPHCDDDGTSGKRVQAIYAHVNGQATVGNADALITAWAEEVDKTFNVSSHKTAPGGFAFPRWAFTAACGQPGSQLDVVHINIADPGTSFQALRNALGAIDVIGATPGTLEANLDRKYMVFLDKPGPDCPGLVSDFLPDTNPDPAANISNQNPGTGFERAMIAAYCLGSWQNPPSPVVFNFGIPHELVHLLGGVNPAAPHSIGGGHTSQFWEVMSAGTVPAVPDCDSSFEGLNKQLLLDCGNDDYFSMAPAAGSYLAGCWNVASSNFLVTSGVNTPAGTSCPPATEAPPPTGIQAPTVPPGSQPAVATRKKCKKKKPRSAEVAKKKKKCKKRKRR